MENKGYRTNKARRTSERRNPLCPNNKGQERRKYLNRRGQKDKRNSAEDLGVFL